MIPAEAFIAIEGLLGKHLQNAFSKVAGDLLREVSALLDSGDYSGATEKAQGLTLEPMFEESKAFIEKQTNMAMLFGASRVSNTPGTSVVGLGFEKTMTAQIVETFRGHFRNAETYLRDKAVQLIAQTRDEKEPVQKAEKRILLDFKSFMDGEGNAQMNLISSLHTSRVSAYGFTAEANVLGLEEYQINEQLDNRICPVCRTMHGKRFKVTDARKLLEVVLRTQDPDQLKSLQPWPKQTKEAVAEMASLTPEEMVARGWHIPPFHPGCRGLLVRVGKAPPSPGTPTVERLPEVIKSDFDVLGVQATPVQVKSWAKNFPVKPEEVISAVTGTPVPDVLAKAVVEGISPLGITDFKVKRGGVSVIADIPIAGPKARSKITNRLELYALFADKVIQIASPSLNAGLTPTTKKMINSAYLLTKDAEYLKLAMRVEGAGAYQWARMGFQISDEDWAKLIILLRIAYHEIKKELSEEARHEVEKLLATSSGASIIALSQLGVDQSGIHVGKAMMAGISYDGYLDVTSPVSMEAFLSGLSS